MTILVDSSTRVLVQAITGNQGSFHTQQMIGYGTQIVGGVTPGHGGEWSNGLPVFDTVSAAREATEANTSVIFVPPQRAADAIIEAVAAEIALIVCITEGIPVLDMMKVYDYIKRSHSRLIGPNCPGILAPGQTNIGIIPGQIARAGAVGVVSRCGALTYEVIDSLTQAGHGQSTIVGIGSDPIIGTSFVDVLEMFEYDPQTEHVVLLGEIGGRAEVDAADYIRSNMTKPVVAFIAGKYAPTDRRMGHAGAIVEGGEGTAQEKIDILKNAGVRVPDAPEQIPWLLR
jgi:succinyl-CoA synthetase alpha subunit